MSGDWQKMVTSYLQFKILLAMIMLFLVSANAVTPSSASTAWITNLSSWYSEGLISKQEIQDTMTYLARNNVVESTPLEIRQVLLESEFGPKYDIQTNDNSVFIISSNQIKSGGPPRDGIPSIDNPKFADANDVDFIKETDLVIGLDVNGDTRAYPLSILVWHEIVNDVVGGMPVAVTYCPLCFTNQVFERTIYGDAVEFGTSGKLYNSNLVMYDRLTESLWSQALGFAITGELTGKTLEKVPFDVMKWKDWKNIHPDTKVLTRDTGHSRAYSVDPYGEYYTEERIIFPVANMDDRMNLKELIVGYHDSGEYVAYKQKDIESQKVINDDVGEKKVLVTSLYEDNARIFDRNVNGKILQFEYVDGKIIDKSTNSEWNYDGKSVSGQLQGTELERLPIEPGFWFEWVAFHPDTRVYSGGSNS